MEPEPPVPDDVESLPDLIRFLEALSEHFRNRRDTDEWQHLLVGDYLDSMAAWLGATPNDPAFRDEKERELGGDAPSWRGVALMFDVARVYE